MPVTPCPTNYPGYTSYFDCRPWRLQWVWLPLLPQLLPRLLQGEGVSGVCRPHPLLNWHSPTWGTPPPPMVADRVVKGGKMPWMPLSSPPLPPRPLGVCPPPLRVGGGSHPLFPHHPHKPTTAAATPTTTLGTQPPPSMVVKVEAVAVVAVVVVLLGVLMALAVLLVVVVLVVQILAHWIPTPRVFPILLPHLLCLLLPLQPPCFLEGGHPGLG